MNRKSFNYLYFFVMMIYMASADLQTRAMELYSTLISPIAYLIPLLLSVIFVVKNKIRFNNNNLVLFAFLLLVWSLCIVFKYSTITLISSTFAFVTLFLAYIHTIGLGKNLFFYYEDIMVQLSKLSILLWLIGLLFPSIARELFHLMPGYDTGSFGDNFFYIFNWMNPDKGHVILGTDISRNAGFSWEAGRFAIMITLAITINLIRNNGIYFRRNRNLIWLLMTLITTFSTTGYCSVIIIMSLFYIKEFSLKTILSSAFIIIPCILLVFNVSFMGEKIETQLIETQTLEKYDAQIAWSDRNFSEGEYSLSLERFPSMIFEFENIIHDPLVGYGKNSSNSFFSNNISSNVIITGGLLKVLAQYGLFVGLLLYVILFRSSKSIAEQLNCEKTYALFVCFILMSISYPIYGVCVFSSVWLYGLFYEKDMDTFA